MELIPPGDVGQALQRLSTVGRARKDERVQRHGEPDACRLGGEGTGLLSGALGQGGCGGSCGWKTSHEDPQA